MSSLNPEALPDKKIENANKLYEEVKSLIEEWDNKDQVKAQKIWMKAKDAISEFGTTNQDKKIELQDIIRGSIESCGNKNRV